MVMGEYNKTLKDDNIKKMLTKITTRKDYILKTKCPF